MDDETLLRGCLEYDPNAWFEIRRLVERLARGLAAPRFNLDSASVDDVTQATMLEILKNDLRLLRDFQRRSALSTYLATIVLRVAGSQLRSVRHEVPLEAVPPPASASDPFYLDRIIYRELFQELASLDRLILTLVAEGYTAQEIAELLTRHQGQPITAAWVRKHKERALKSIKHHLGKDKS